MTRVCVDFFSGLGGFSEAFRDREDWKVIRFDYDRKFRHIPNTQIVDIMKLDILRLRKLGALKPDILLMSPPCECFSLMSVYHYWIEGRPKVQKTRDAIALVNRSLELKDLLQPDFWVLENPNGMMVKVLGKPNHYTWWGAWYSERDLMMLRLKELGIELPPMKPTSLWGVLPDIQWRPKPKKGEYQAAPRGSKSGIQNSKLRPEVRSCIPYDFSLALVEAVENSPAYQTTFD
ncbi:MAG: DNA cytosine methyltransferase [Candidatus Thorarchaeota archaeon]|jgi:hypothetical protein